MNSSCLRTLQFTFSVDTIGVESDRKATSLSELTYELAYLSHAVFPEAPEANHQTTIPKFHQEPMEIVDLLCLRTTTNIFGMTKFAKIAFSCVLSLEACCKRIFVNSNILSKSILLCPELWGAEK